MYIWKEESIIFLGLNLMCCLYLLLLLQYYYLTTTLPVINGWTAQWKSYSPASIFAVTISTLFGSSGVPGRIILVSNFLPASGSSGPLPFVTVCGKESSLITSIVSPSFPYYNRYKFTWYWIEESTTKAIAFVDK